MPFNPNQDPPDGGVKLQFAGGYIIIGFNDDGCAVVHELYVNPNDRRKGTGSALMSFAKAWAKSEGYYPLILECSPSNAEGRAFYESLGMKAVSIVYQMEVK